MIKSGRDTEYRLLHYWVEKQLGKPQECSKCGTTDDLRETLENMFDDFNAGYYGQKRFIDEILALFATQTAQLKERVLEAIGENDYLHAYESSAVLHSKRVRNTLRKNLRAAIEQIWRDL